MNETDKDKLTVEVHPAEADAIQLGETRRRLMKRCAGGALAIPVVLSTITAAAADCSYC